MFDAGNIFVSTDHLAEIVERFGNHPMYIQLFCFFLWRELQDDPWDDTTMDRIERAVIDQKHLEYQMLWDNLTINQKKL